MKGSDTVAEKPPVLLREDSKYTLEKLMSIITSDNYEDLRNHSTEAMGETRLFSIVQVIAFVHFLYIFLSCHVSNSASLLGNVEDEGAGGLLPKP